MTTATIRVRRTPPPDFGPALTAARTAAGLNASQAARAAGISGCHWRNLEAGRRCPSVTVAQAIADVLDLDDATRAVFLAAAITDAGRDHPARRNAPFRDAA